MTNKYLKPMLDTGSPRVFNCNEMSAKILAAAPEAPLFFQTKRLNTIVLIKDTIPENERRPGMPTVGTKLYFPFNETNIYEGGRTIFMFDRAVANAIIGYCGEGAIKKELFDQDLRKLEILDRLPSLDPFLMKDAFLRQRIEINPAYFEVSPEAWAEIETFMLQKFEPLVLAAFPDSQSSDDKARTLIDKIWEARDLEALKPLIDAFRLPEAEALDIFASWKGIVFYSFQYQKEQAQLLALVRWLKENEVPVAGVTAAEAKELVTLLNGVKERLRAEWQAIEDVVRAYQTSYDKMFKERTSSTEFLAFLKNSNETYWKVGNNIGKVYHAIYCWDVMTQRFDERRLPWAARLEVARLLAKIFEPDKKTTTSVAWS